jgi:hypothetical protein
MSRVIHVRLDSQTEEMFDRIKRRLGWSNSKIIQEGIKAMSGLIGSGCSRTIIGLGRFHSGIRDLGSNEDHMRGFGQRK